MEAASVATHSVYLEVPLGLPEWASILDQFFSSPVVESTPYLFTNVFTVPYIEGCREMDCFWEESEIQLLLEKEKLVLGIAPPIFHQAPRAKIVQYR